MDTARLEKAAACLMPLTHYAQLTHELPYRYRYRDQLQVLGVPHTYDPQAAIWPQIAALVNRSQIDIVVVEGVQALCQPAQLERLVAGASPVALISRGGESMYTIKQALAARLPWLCPEPDDTELYHHLIYELYSRDEIAAWHALRLLPQYHARDEQLPFSGYAAPFIRQFKAATAWPQFDYSLEHALAVAQSILGRPVRVHNRDQAYELTDPVPWPARWEAQTVFNDISRAALSFRDQHIVATVGQELLHGKRVGMVYGAGHAVMQEPAYRYLLTGDT